MLGISKELNGIPYGALGPIPCKMSRSQNIKFFNGNINISDVHVSEICPRLPRASLPLIFIDCIKQTNPGEPRSLTDRFAIDSY